VRRLGEAVDVERLLQAFAFNLIRLNMALQSEYHDKLDWDRRHSDQCHHHRRQLDESSGVDILESAKRREEELKGERRLQQKKQKLQSSQIYRSAKTNAGLGTSEQDTQHQHHQQPRLFVASLKAWRGR
jgi:hypothetical protein